MSNTKYSLDQSISVPFIGDEHITYTNGDHPAIERILKSHFGDISKIVILDNQVLANGKVVLDLDAPEPSRSVKRSPRPKPAVAEFKASQKSNNGSQEVFSLQKLNDLNRLQIAIHSDLTETHRKALKQLIQQMAEHSADSCEIDLNACSAVSVTGIGILLLIKEKSGMDKDALVLKNCSESVMERLKWAGMDNYFSLSQ